MLEPELFSLLEQTADAAYTVTEGGEICSWNRAAERLFGYPASDVLGRNIDDVLEARDVLDIDALAGGSEVATRRWDGTSGGIPNFDLEVHTFSGDRIWVNVSTIIFDNRRTGRRSWCVWRATSHRFGSTRQAGHFRPTLRNHLHHINRKLRTHTRLEAVTHAQQRGLIE